MMANNISINLEKVREKIHSAACKAGRDPSDILLLAVTKSVGINEVRLASALGLQDFGENRLQEALPKVESFPRLRWHFIGHLQSNKAKHALKKFCLIHSLDRFSLARELQRYGEKLELNAEVLIQVNVAGERSKFGLEPGELPDFLLSMEDMNRIKVKGLMTMAPWVENPEEARSVFVRLRELRRDNARPGLTLPHLSMGMTNDYTVAIEEGATIVRLGSALFASQS